MTLSPDAVLISDSITKNLGPMRKFKVYTYRGCDVRRLLLHVIKSPHIVSGYKYIFVHIGTNNFGNRKEWSLYKDFIKGKVDESELRLFEDYVREPDRAELSVDEFSVLYDKLLMQIRVVNPSAILICSAIIPRVWDHMRRDSVRRQFNKVISSSVCKYNAFFIPTWTVFYKGYQLKEHFFDDDGLHLSTAGGLALGCYFADKLCKGSKGLLV